MTGTGARLASALGVAAAVILVWPTDEAGAQRRIACGEFYEVQPGDTLREIAVDAYRVGNYQIIFDANRDILSTPSLLLVGQRLFIPCLDGSGPATRQEAEAAIVQGQQAVLQAPELAPERFALPTALPLPAEEEPLPEEAAAEPDAAEAADEVATGTATETETAAAPAPEEPQRQRRVVRTEIIPQPEGSRTRPAVVVGVQPLQPGAPGPSRQGSAPAPEPVGQQVAALQPAPGAVGAAVSGPALAGIQPAPGAGGTGGGASAAGIQPAPGTSGTGGGASAAGIQPAPGTSGRTTGGASAAAIQPAPGATGSTAATAPQAAPAGGAAAGIQPAPGATGRTGGGAATAGIQPAPGASSGAGAGAQRPAVSDGRGEGFDTPVIARLLPPSAPRPAQQPAPDQPVPRMVLDPGVSLRADRPAPDQPAQFPADVAAVGSAAGSVADDEEAAIDADAVSAPVIRILTGPYAPYSGETLPEGGMLTDVVSRALGHSAPERTFRMSYISDWALHLDVLLPDGAFDLGYPWFKPDCTRLELLSLPMQRRCTEYHWSQPLHELVVGYFVRAGGPAEGTVDPADLVGLTFCRPRGYYTFDLEQRGLGVPAVTLVTPDEPGDCLRALVNGEVDVVPLSVTLVEGEMARLGLAGQVAELPELADILTLHVLSHRSNPFGRTYLTLINRGLREMRDTGEWFQVVARHLAEYSEATQ